MTTPTEKEVKDFLEMLGYPQVERIPTPKMSDLEKRVQELIKKLL